MPREQITPAINTAPPTSDGGHFMPLPTVQVGWQRDLGGVQVGLETPVRMVGGDSSSGQHHLLDHLYGREATLDRIGVHLAYRMGALADGAGAGELARALERRAAAADSVEEHAANVLIGRQVLDSVTGAAEGYTGWYTHLDQRQEVNRLIRVLRRARDAAFGRDE